MERHDTDGHSNHRLNNAVNNLWDNLLFGQLSASFA